jgi:hypothetical protein
MRASAAVFVFALAIASCTDSGSPIDFGDPSAPIYPLATGNTWTYRISYYDTLGALFQVSDYTDTIGSSRILGAQEWYFWHDPSQYLANLPGGTWYRVIQADTTTPAQLYFKYPAAVGDRWVTDFLLGSPSEVTLVSKNTRVQVPAGRFACHVYRYGDTKSVDYLVPGIGRVYSEIYPRVPSGKTYKYVFELTDYRLR